MKSFQNFAYNIVEGSGYAKPTGVDAFGRPTYAPPPTEQLSAAERKAVESGTSRRARRARAGSPSYGAVKADIEARERFKALKKGGLDTRTNIPNSVTRIRQQRAINLLGPDVWDQPKGAGEKSFNRGLRRLTSGGQPSRGHQNRAFRDFIMQSADELGTSTDEIIANMMRGTSAQKITSARAEPDPWKPSETATTPPKPKPVSQAEVSQKQAEYRQAQKTPPAQKTTTSAGGTPKAVSFSTSSRSKSTGSPRTSVVDVNAKTVPGSKVAEPKPKTLPGLKLGTEPAGPLVSNRPGESKTIRPQKGPGRTGVLGKPKAGQMIGAKIEPVKVADITSKPKVTTSLPQAKTTKISLPKPPKPTLKPKVVTPTVTTVKAKELKIPQPAAPKIKPLSATRTTQSQKLADTVVKAAKQVRSEIAAEKAAERAKLMKGIGTAGKVLGVVGTGIEAKKGYDIAKAMGSSQKRSVGAGAARAIGSGLGGVVGGTLGSIAGPVGSAVGATAGLTVGAELGSKAYNVITGDPKKKVTTQGVLTNIRKAVPQSVRAQVPANVRKGFTDFVKSAGRTYGDWQRSQENKK